MGVYFHRFCFDPLVRVSVGISMRTPSFPVELNRTCAGGKFSGTKTAGDEATTLKQRGKFMIVFSSFEKTA